MHLRAGACLFVCVCVIDSMVPFPLFFNVDTAPDGGLASHKLDRCIAYHWHQAVGWGRGGAWGRGCAKSGGGGRQELYNYSYGINLAHFHYARHSVVAL